MPEISSILNISRTTVFRYASKVHIQSEFVDSWKAKRGGSTARMVQAKEHAYTEAKNILNHLTDKEKMLFLCALYWGEGSKKDFGLSNTDPVLVRVFVIILHDIFKVKKSDLRISIRIYEDLEKDVCLDFWSKIVGVPKEDFVSVNVLHGKKTGKLKYGMCRVRTVKGGSLLKKIQGINKVVGEIL